MSINEKLSQALRAKAARIADLVEDGRGAELDIDEHRDTVELLKVLDRIVDGMPIAKAFGAPATGGYNTAIGEALAASTLNRPPNPPTCAHGKTMHQGCEACGHGRTVA